MLYMNIFTVPLETHKYLREKQLAISNVLITADFVVACLPIWPQPQNLLAH